MKTNTFFHKNYPIRFIMSEQQKFNDLFITSAVITGPIVDGVNFGPCVNIEYSNCVMKNSEIEDIRFDNQFDIEERKEPYCDEELNEIYFNQKALYEEDLYYERTYSQQMEKERQLYWEQLYQNEEEYIEFMKQEEDREIELECFIGKLNR